MNIVSPTTDFDFSNITLSSPPIKLADGLFFTKLINNESPLYVQTPTGKTKNGINITSNPMRADLVFDPEISRDFISWVEKLEERCGALIYEKSTEWFQSVIEPNDIDGLNIFKSYKSGRFQIISTTIRKLSDNINELIIYDEGSNMKEPSDVKADSSIISIIEICGIQFSTKSFKVTVELKQLMLLDPPPSCLEEVTDVSPFKTCLIRPDVKDPIKPEINEGGGGNQILETEMSPEPEPAATNELNDLVEIDVDEYLEETSHDVIPDELTSTNTQLNTSSPHTENVDIQSLDNILDVPGKPEQLLPDIVLEETPESSDDNSSLSFSLKSREAIYTDKYDLAKKKVEQLKHEFIQATVALEALKHEYGLTGSDYE